MDLTSRLKIRLFRRATLNELRSPKTREETLRFICEWCSQEHAAHPEKVDVWRQPIHDSADIFAEEGLDEVDVFRAAARAMPGEGHWRHEILKRVLPREKFDPRDIEFLEKEVAVSPRKLAVWQRYLQEVQATGDAARFERVREDFVLALAEFFPANGESTWYDVETEAQARSLFFNSLDDACDAVARSKRTDERALRLLTIGQKFFPQRAEVVCGLAHIYRTRGEKSVQHLETILEALLYEPNDTDLKIYAAEMLMTLPSHRGEGVEMLLQVWREEPDNERAVELLARHLKQQPGIDESQVEILRRWFASHRGDAEAAALIADYYAGNDGETNEALDAFRAVTELKPTESYYLKLLGQALLKRQEWVEVASIYERLAELEDYTEDIVLPLADAYAQLGRTDARALNAYREAFRLGIKKQSVIDLYCRTLYRDNPSSLEALEVFHRVYRSEERCTWAALGVARKELAEGKPEAALEKIAAVLAAGEEIDEAVELAAGIIASEPKRAFLRQLMTLPPDVALPIFQRAAIQQPDALNVLSNLARYRLNRGMRDAETEQLLATICNRDPAEVELRVARADLLFDLGRRDTGVELYKELLERLKANSSALKHSREFLEEQRPRMLGRVVEYLESAPQLSDNHLEFLIQLGFEPTTDPELMLRVARSLARCGQPHTLDLPLFERALALVPDDEELEVAEARARLARGNDRPLIHLAIRRVERLNYDATTLALLDEAASHARPQHISDEVEARILRLFESRRLIPESIAFGLSRLLIASQRFKPVYRPALRKAAMLQGAPPEILEALEKCRKAGQDESRGD